MSVKPWPANNEPAHFEQLTDPIYKAIKAAYKFQFRGYRNIEWTGLDIGQREKVTCLPFDEQLTAESLRYNCQDQGRSPLETMISIAVQSGIEQGRRIERERADERAEHDSLMRELREARELRESN